MSQAQLQNHVWVCGFHGVSPHEHTIKPCEKTSNTKAPAETIFKHTAARIYETFFLCAHMRHPELVKSVLGNAASRVELSQHVATAHLPRSTTGHENEDKTK